MATNNGWQQFKGGLSKGSDWVVAAGGAVLAFFVSKSLFEGFSTSAQYDSQGNPIEPDWIPFYGTVKWAFSAIAAVGVGFLAMPSIINWWRESGKPWVAETIDLTGKSIRGVFTKTSAAGDVPPAAKTTDVSHHGRVMNDRHAVAPESLGELAPPPAQLASASQQDIRASQIF